MLKIPVGEYQTPALNYKVTQQINNIEDMVTTIVESNNRIKELKRRWCDVLKQNLKNIDKNKDIPVEANTLLKKKVIQSGGKRTEKTMPSSLVFLRMMTNYNSAFQPKHTN